MTMQIRDKLTYNGAELELRSFPLPPEKLKEAQLKSNGSVSSGCWRGYVGRWEIKDDTLYLTSLDLKSFEPKPFSEIFKEATEKGLEATWVSGTLECDGGGVIKNDFMLGPTFARTITFTLENGRVISADEVENDA